MIRYRVQLPEQELKDGRKVKIESIVLRDVFMGDDNRKNVAVTIFSPVVVSDGYLPVDTFKKSDWDLSLEKGQVRALIDKGVIVVEDDSAPVQATVPTQSASQTGEVHVASVHAELAGRDAKPQVAKVIPAMVGTKSAFESMSHSDKIQFVKKLDIEGLNKLMKEEKLNGFFTNMVNAGIKRLSQPQAQPAVV